MEEGFWLRPPFRENRPPWGDRKPTFWASTLQQMEWKILRLFYSCNWMFSPSQNPCNSSPCIKHATCRPSFLDDDSYAYVCQTGFTRAMCNERQKCLLEYLSLYDDNSLMDQWTCFKKRLAAHNLINTCSIQLHSMIQASFYHKVSYQPRSQSI